MFESFSFTEWLSTIKHLIYLVVAFALYSIFIFKFYRFTAHKDIFKLYLYRRSTISHAGLRNFVKVLLYFVEYIILFPFIVMIWIVVLTVLFALISKIDNVHVIITLAVAIVGTIRVAAYYNEDLAKDIAKLIPFALLAYFLIDMASYVVNPAAFSTDHYLRMGYALPGIAHYLLHYYLFAIVLEIALRIGFGILHPILTYDKDYGREDE
ncbi:MAG: hypothetical protein KKG59_06470 [Nanoarchaeota archaeon]|nr:hypothetical protein [Nanoarchaeota archaeon]